MHSAHSRRRRPSCERCRSRLLLSASPAAPAKLVTGLVAPTLTPFHANGTVDLAGVDRQANFLQATNVSRVFCSGTTGESVDLTARRAQAHRRAVDGALEAVGRVPRHRARRRRVDRRHEGDGGARRVARRARDRGDAAHLHQADVARRARRDVRGDRQQRAQDAALLLPHSDEDGRRLPDGATSRGRGPQNPDAHRHQVHRRQPPGPERGAPRRRRPLQHSVRPRPAVAFARRCSASTAPSARPTTSSARRWARARAVCRPAATSRRPRSSSRGRCS